MTVSHLPATTANDVTGQGCYGDIMCPEYKVVAADVERVADQGEAGGDGGVVEPIDQAL
jgi:hypothetical protein